MYKIDVYILILSVHHVHRTVCTQSLRSIKKTLINIFIELVYLLIYGYSARSIYLLFNGYSARSKYLLIYGYSTRSIYLLIYGYSAGFIYLLN